MIHNLSTHIFTVLLDISLAIIFILIVTLKVITPFFLFIILLACTVYLRDDVTFHLNKTKTKTNVFIYCEITNQTCDKNPQSLYEFYISANRHISISCVHYLSCLTPM